MPISDFQTILDHPSYPTVDQSVKNRLTQKASLDPEVKALPDDQRIQFLNSIHFPGVDETRPALAGNLSPAETVQSMKEGIGGGIKTLREASAMPQGKARLGQDISGGAQIVGGIGAPFAALSTEAGRLAQKGASFIPGADKPIGSMTDPIAYWRSKFVGGPTPKPESFSASDVFGAVTSAGLPFMLAKMGNAATGYIKRRFGSNVTQADIEAARQAIIDAKAEVETAKQPVTAAAQNVSAAKQNLDAIKATEAQAQTTAATTSGLTRAQQEAADAALAAKQANLVQRQGAQGAEAGLKDVQGNLPDVGGVTARTQIGTQIQNDIQSKVDELVAKSRSLYGPIRAEAANIPTGKTKLTLSEIPTMAESGPVNPRTMRETAQTWRDLSGETMGEIQDRMAKDPTLNFGSAAQQVLESKSKQTVADLIDQKQRASFIMRKAENSGQDNAARIARNERDAVDAQIQASALPNKTKKALAAADKFYATEYAPVASYGAFPRTVRDMPIEDMADQIVRIGNKKAAIESWDAMTTALTPDTRNRLASYTFENMLKRGSPNGVFDPAKAVASFERMDPELRRKVFGPLAPDIGDALETFKVAAGNKVKAERMANALQDAAKIAELKFNKVVAEAGSQVPAGQEAVRTATEGLNVARGGLTTAQTGVKTAEQNYADVMAKSSAPQKLAEARISKAMGGRGMMFMKIIGAEEMVRGSLNEWQGNYGIGTAQILRGATLAMPIQIVRLLTSPGGKAVASSLSRLAGPTNQAYMSTVKKLSDAILNDAMETGMDRAKPVMTPDGPVAVPVKSTPPVTPLSSQPQQPTAGAKFDALPPAGNLKGAIIRDDATGKRLQSDGTQWQELR